MTDTLEKLFGSHARVKLLRLFLYNPTQMYTVEDAAERAREKVEGASKEIALFHRLGLLKKIPRVSHDKYILNEDFAYVAALQSLLLNTPARAHEIVKRLQHTGALKLVVISGIFIGQWDDRLDLFVVVDRLKERKFIDRIKLLEAEIGKEIRYTYLSSEQFFYRFNMNDRLIRDVFDYQHRIALDKLDIGLK